MSNKIHTGRLKSHHSVMCEQHPTFEDIADAFAGYTYDAEEFQSVILKGLLDRTAGYRIAHSAQTVLIELGLCDEDTEITELGAHYLCYKMSSVVHLVDKPSGQLIIEFWDKNYLIENSEQAYRDLNFGKNTRDRALTAWEVAPGKSSDSWKYFDLSEWNARLDELERSK